jgi:hypothetical protein
MGLAMEVVGCRSSGVELRWLMYDLLSVFMTFISTVLNDLNLE